MKSNEEATENKHHILPDIMFFEDIVAISNHEKSKIVFPQEYPKNAISVTMSAVKIYKIKKNGGLRRMKNSPTFSVVNKVTKKYFTIDTHVMDDRDTNNYFIIIHWSAMGPKPTK